ncbi:UNVERIFIED_CONTAM: hypothetical protein PYX00_010116 [Menopon gallinae]|uniref:Carboxypeptidase n=1 Tax=Menopon gallinae TaxID=328185 RepID=A0AAW2HE47_9NEOP
MMYRILCLSVVLSLGYSFPANQDADVWKEPPLILTPFIESGKIEEARAKALVTQLKPNITSYAGFFNVDKKCDSNLFFWFFPSQSNMKKDPVSFWVNGDPGSSSMFGLLTENGPYDLTLKNELKLREYSWNRNSSVIYFDIPVGTGYSFTRGKFPDCYARNQTQVGRAVLTALEQFFKLFPELRNNQFYLTGESYAGKYLPGIAYAIHTSKTSVRLSGIAIGNGWTDPFTQLETSQLLYQLGFIDEKDRDNFKVMEKKTQQLILENRLNEACDLMNALTDKFLEKANISNMYNYLTVGEFVEPDVGGYLNRTEVRKALHVGNATLYTGELTYEAMKCDIMRTMKPWMEVLMDNYRVLFYYGQMDLWLTYTPSIEFIKTLHWKGMNDYKNADRKLYKVGDDLAGYVKTAGNFTEMLIRNAGHMVPTDQPKWALDMYNKFIFNIPFAR